MEHYRLLTLARSQGGCESRRHIQPILDAAYPRVDKTNGDAFDNYEKREKEGKLFFSQSDLKEYFSQPATADQLLGCECQDCSDARDIDNTKLSISTIRDKLRRLPLFLALMVYLDRFHYVYLWMQWNVDFGDKSSLPECPGETQLQAKIKTFQEIAIFRRVYGNALEMFSPVVFKIPEDGICLLLDCHSTKRFPYTDEKSSIKQGSFGRLTKHEIVPEYLHHTIRARMKDYPSSINDKNNNTPVFAVKSVKIGPSTEMERDALHLVSRIKSPNIITSLAHYKWKGSIHFLMPYIETDLDQVLRSNAYPTYLSSTLEPGQDLPDNWLWKEIKGVSQALSYFHSKMENPFEDKPGEVIALHFDLKPANILVTGGRKLLITDFGQSIIQLIKKGSDMTVPHNTGHPRYMPPEGRPTSECLKASKEINVLLNYDVWSMACIMVEVLIHLLNNQQSLKDFHKTLGQGKGSGFSTEKGDLKECVNRELETFQGKFQHDYAHNEYIRDIVELLRNMLSYDNRTRPYSLQVVQSLEAAETSFQALRQGRDPLAKEVKKQGFKDPKNLQEIGWYNGISIVSFCEKDGIILTLIEQATGRPRYNGVQNPCRIRLWANRPSDRAEIGLVWGVQEQGGPLVVDQRRIDPQRWCFVPKYLFPEHVNQADRFDCILFPQTMATSPEDYDVVFIFGFPSRQDAVLFQDSLFQRRTFHSISAIVQSLDPKRSEEAPDIRPGESIIQLWAKETPKYLLNPNRSSGDNSVRGSIDSSSTTRSRTTVQAKSGQCDSMTFFAEGYRPLVFPLNDGRKTFAPNFNSGRMGVNIVWRQKMKNAKSIYALQPPEYHAASSRGAVTREYGPCLPIEPDAVKMEKLDGVDLVKIKRFEIILKSESDLDIFFEATENEWTEQRGMGR